MASKPMQRSLSYLRKQAWQCGIVEKWNGHVMRRQDLWNFADIIACRSIPDPEIALVQTTTALHFAEHKAKILAIPEFQKWKDAGGLVLLHGWAKRGPRGKRKVWTLREEML